MALHVTHEAPPRAASRAVGAGALAALERPIARLEEGLSLAVSREWNPLAQTGAIANALLVIAIASGVALLVWYVPEVTQAHASLAAMDAAPYGSGLVRSLHRYSSDACMLFVLLHALQVVVQRRFEGARWLAWVTGAALLALLWITGWLGYWLVWDERAHRVALGTARALDVLPVFAEPFSRAFLADSMVGSATFFTVFFVHMLLPLPMGVALWLHVTRIARPRLLPSLAMSLWVTASLVLVSAAWPATVAAKARMAHLPERFTMDWWYLWPVALSDRLSGGAIWAAVLVIGGVVLSVPWWLARRGDASRAATVSPEQCHGCTQCFQDCPFDAVRMVPRTAGKSAEPMSSVDPARCLSCGICVGSCSSAAIDLPWMPVHSVVDALEAALERATAAGAAGPRTAILCSHAIGADVDADALAAARARLPGYEVVTAPCAGWANQTLVARVLRRGSPGVLVVGCAEAACRYREGGEWTRRRLLGEREPDIVPRWGAERVRLERIMPGDGTALERAARAFSAEGARPDASGAAATGARTSLRSGRARALLAGALTTALLGVATLVGSDAPYRAPPSGGPALVVSLKHPGRTVEILRDPAADDPTIPKHMRPQRTFERRRATVRLRIEVDGAIALEKSYAPSGLWGDGASIALETVTLSPGRHDVRISVGDGADAAEWTYSEARALDIGTLERRVVLFERANKFEWN